MNLVNYLLAMICLILTSTALADQPSSDEIAIQHLFEQYMAKYNHYLQQGELPSQPNLYMDSIMLMSSTSEAKVATAQEFNQQVKKFLDALKEKGVHSVTWDSVEIKLLDHNLALASNIAIRFKQSGEVFNRVGATYLLNKTEQKWRIAAFAVHNQAYQRIN